MFSPTVRAPLTCSPGSSRGSKPSYCSISDFDFTSKAALSSAVHQSLRLPVPSYCAPWSSKPWPISWPMTAPMPP